MTSPRAHPVFSVTVDLVVLTVRDDALCALVVGGDPARTLPGDRVRAGESLYDAAVRVLGERVGAATGAPRLEQLASYGEPDRDPRERTVSVAWLAVVPHGADEAPGSTWAPVNGLRPGAGGGGRLALDHDRILADGVERARSKLEYTAMATAFVEEEFTVAELRRVYQVIWDSDLDAGNFHRKVTNAEGFLEATGRTVRRGPGRPAELFRWGGADALQPPLLRASMR